MLARPCIFWYYSGRCERDSEDPYEDPQQSKIKKKIYRNIDNTIERNKEIIGLNKN